MTVREPILSPVVVARLRPTQITVGRREVELKRRAWREHSDKKDAQFLGRHMIPTVLGPGGRYYIVDHHHLALALWEEKVKEVLVTAIADLSRLDMDAFWPVMDARGWTHPFDENGKRCGYKDIPKSLRDLKDDPYRALAGELRRMGGFAKDTTPFSEFQWADFLRRQIKAVQVKDDFPRTLEKALALAKSAEADYLPGWCGPIAEDQV